jgi:hypothetical protein
MSIVVLPCSRIFGYRYLVSDNGNDTGVETSVSLIPFLEGAKGRSYHSEFAVSFPGCGQKVTVGIKTRYQQR